MPKLSSSGSIKKINITQILETGNIRADYTEIEELAASIKSYGQLQPVLVKHNGKNKDDIDEYELIAGHRRVRALRYLCEAGDDFSHVDALVVSGDKLTLQLIENLQRTDLTAREREQGIYEMTKDGAVSQKEVALMLGKNEQYVWRNINGYKIRELAEKQGVNTGDISTNTLLEIASAADGDIPLLIERIKDEGGTLQAARRISREYRKEISPSLIPEASEENETPETPSTGNETEAEIDIDEILGEKDETGNEDEDADENDVDDYDEDYENDDDEAELDIDISTMCPPKASYGEPPKRSPTRTLADFDPPHKQVDINDVLVIIKDYIDNLEDMYSQPELTHRQEVAWDIIALLHKKLK
jgi:ParB/RepB/Spo0J family partition protein